VSDTPRIHLLVGMPCYGGQLFYTTAASLMKLQDACRQLDWGMTLYFFANESLVQRARNRVVSHLMSPINAACTHLLFIDADIGFEAQDVVRMVQFNHDVVAGPYPKKEILWEKAHSAAQRGVAPKDLHQYAVDHVVNLKDKTIEGVPTTFCRMEGGGTFCEVKDAGTGFMLIKREVIEKMMAAFPELEYVPDHGEQYGSPPYALFDCIIEPETKRYLSEDWTFCRRWQQLGGEVYSMISAQLTHTGTFTFRGDAETLLGLKEPDYSDLPVEFVDVKEVA